jgi:hypothetical protein
MGIGASMPVSALQHVIEERRIDVLVLFIQFLGHVA